MIRPIHRQDLCTFHLHLKMEEYVFKLIDKDFLDPLDILSKYNDCKDEGLLDNLSKSNSKLYSLHNNIKENPC